MADLLIHQKFVIIKQGHFHFQVSVSSIIPSADPKDVENKY